VQTLKAVGSSLVEIHGSMTSARWSMPRPTGGCSTRSRSREGRSRAGDALGRKAAANTVLDEHRAAMDRAAREADLSAPRRR